MEMGGGKIAGKGGKGTSAKRSPQLHSPHAGLQFLVGRIHRL